MDLVSLINCECSNLRYCYHFLVGVVVMTVTFQGNFLTIANQASISMQMFSLSSVGSMDCINCFAYISIGYVKCCIRLKFVITGVARHVLIRSL